MTPQTTFATPYNPWKTHPEHRPRPWAVEPEPEPAPVVVAVEKKGRNCFRGVVLAQIAKLGSASCNDLVDSMSLTKNSIRCALTGLVKEGKVRIKNVPIVNRKPSHLYFPKDADAQS